jgi:hypothetical protein
MKISVQQKMSLATWTEERKRRENGGPSRRPRLRTRLYGLPAMPPRALQPPSPRRPPCGAGVFFLMRLRCDLHLLGVWVGRSALSFFEWGDRDWGVRLDEEQRRQASWSGHVLMIFLPDSEQYRLMGRVLRWHTPHPSTSLTNGPNCLCLAHPHLFHLPGSALVETWHNSRKKC